MSIAITEDHRALAGTAADFLTKPVEGTAWRNDLAEKALAELGDLDTKGASWTKATVTLTEGGQ